MFREAHIGIFLLNSQKCGQMRERNHLPPTPLQPLIPYDTMQYHPNLIELLSESFFSFFFFFFSSVTLRVPPPPLINFYTI